MRVGEGIPHPGLGRQVDHSLRADSLEQFRDGVPIRKVQPLESEPGAAFELRQSGVFEAHIVVVIQVVRAINLIPAFEKALGQMESDEPSSAGD